MPYIKREFALCQAIIDQLLINLDALGHEAGLKAFNACYRQALASQDDLTLFRVIEAAAEVVAHQGGSWDEYRSLFAAAISTTVTDPETYFLATEALANSYARQGLAAEAAKIALTQINPVVRVDLAGSVAETLHAYGHHAAAEHLLMFVPAHRRARIRRAAYAVASAQVALSLVEFLPRHERLEVIASPEEKPTPATLVESFTATLAARAALGERLTPSLCN